MISQHHYFQDFDIFSGGRILQWNMIQQNEMAHAYVFTKFRLENVVKASEISHLVL